MQLDVKKVEYVLGLGKLYLGVERLILFIGSCIPLLVPISTIIMAVLNYLYSLNIFNDILFPLVFANIFTLVISTICIIKLIRNKQNILKTQLFLKDATNINCHIKRVDITDRKFKPYQVEISFKHNGKEFKKISPPGNPLTGYDKYLTQLDTTNITFLYSSKYDKILIVKK